MFLPVVGQARAAMMALKALSDAAESLTVQTLRAEHADEFLLSSPRARFTRYSSPGSFAITGWRANSNRGTFHAYRDRQGRLEGVALIGHFTLVEARSEVPSKLSRASRRIVTPRI